MNPLPIIPAIPIHHKLDADDPRPADAEFYWITRSGVFFCRNHEFFSAETLARQMPQSLAPHQTGCRVHFPLLGVAALEYVVGFFDVVYRLHGSEAFVLLLWDRRRKRYRLCVPRQRATVWRSRWGDLSPVDVTYEIPRKLPPDYLIVGDIHSHGDLRAYQSATDLHDTHYRDGVHVVVGRLDRDEPPEFNLELMVDGARFVLQFGHLFKGYRRRRRDVPQTWLDQLQIKCDGPSCGNVTSTTVYKQLPPGPGNSPAIRRSNWNGNQDA